MVKRFVARVLREDLRCGSWFVHKSQEFDRCIASGWRIYKDDHTINIVALFESDAATADEEEMFKKNVAHLEHGHVHRCLLEFHWL